RTSVAVGDRGQDIYPFASSEQTGLQVQTFANPTRPTSDRANNISATEVGRVGLASVCACKQVCSDVEKG
ncbi:MAG: hypothetical protein ACKPKO_53595, partial [Candidatus Fonsibacter sp.]